MGNLDKVAGILDATPETLDPSQVTDKLVGVYEAVKAERDQLKGEATSLKGASKGFAPAFSSWNRSAKAWNLSMRSHMTSDLSSFVSVIQESERFGVSARKIERV